MTNMFTTAGSKLFIGGAPKEFNDTDFVAGDFNGIAWTPIGGLTNLGSAGDTSELVVVQPMGGRARKLKGNRNAGSMEIVATLDYADAGQLALIEAEKSDYTFPFKIEFRDAPAGGTPSLRYFTAMVMSQSEGMNEANNAVTLNATLEIDSNFVRVNATA